MTLKTLTHINNRPVIVDIVDEDSTESYAEKKHKEQVESNKRLMKIMDSLYSEDVINDK